MSHWKWMGQTIPIRVDGVIVDPPVLSVRLRRTDGVVVTITAPDAINGFAVGESLGPDITDARCLRHLNADPRFAIVV